MGNEKLIQKIKPLLKRHFGYDTFRPHQLDVIQSVLQKRDALVLMPTGGGKSLCYQLPAVCLDGVTIVISPLISLMKDQVDSLKSNGISAEFINSSLPFKQIEEIQDDLKRGDIKILYIAPERIVKDGFLLFLKSLTINLFAIDEAHCISAWGHDFRPDYRNLHNLRFDFPAIPIVALTATATKRVQDDIIIQLRLKEPEVFISSFNRHNLTYSVIPKQNPIGELLPLLKKYHGESVIIYCMSRRGCVELAETLEENRFLALPYHAGLSSSLRKETQDKFIRDEISIIVATIAFGMGIDKPDIRLVVHYDLPGTMEGYYQETGRAGRDGLLSECILFYSYADRIKYDYLIEQISDENEKQLAKVKIGQVITYCELTSCRRKYLLAYFGETYSKDNCRTCDCCISPQDETDCTVVSQKILSCIIRTKERFGMNYIIDVLRGANTSKIRSNGHDTVSTYGIVSDFDARELKHIMLSLIAKGLIKKDGDKYPVLGVSSSGWAALKNRAPVFLVKPRKIKSKEEKRGINTETYSDKEVYSDLFYKLRALRKTIAQEMGVPPFIVFGDVSLKEMAANCPQSVTSFLMISGVGNKKVQTFGDRFLSVICAYAKENEKSDLLAVKIKESKDRVSTIQKTLCFLNEEMPLDEIAKIRGLTKGTIVSHIERLKKEGYQIDISYLRPKKEDLEKILTAFDRSGGTALSPVKEALDDTFSYDEIRLARMFWGE